jgi:hypothetical protein
MGLQSTGYWTLSNKCLTSPRKTPQAFSAKGVDFITVLWLLDLGSNRFSRTDMNQSLLPAIYPILKDSYHLDFGQVGLITLAFQVTASRRAGGRRSATPAG